MKKLSNTLTPCYFLLWRAVDVFDLLCFCFVVCVLRGICTSPDCWGLPRPHLATFAAAMIRTIAYRVEITNARIICNASSIDIDGKLSIGNTNRWIRRGS